MRSRLAAFAWTLLPAMAGAQSPQNHVVRWDGTTEYASRGLNGVNPGFVSAAFPYGLSAKLTTLTRTQYVIQDMEMLTPEPWNVGVCGLDARGDPSYATTRFYATNLVLPIGSGVGAFVVTHTPLANAPLPVPATMNAWHHVWQFTVGAPPADGIAVHMSEAAPWGPTLLCQLNPNMTPGHREIPRADPTQILEDLAWSTQPPRPAPLPMNLAWHLQTSWAEVALSGGIDNLTYNNAPCPNPNFGLAAIDPDFADVGRGTPPRNDDYVWEVRAGAAYAGGAGMLLLSQAVFPNGGIATPYGQLHVDITDPLFAIGPLLMPALDSQGFARLVLNLGPASSLLRQVITTLPCISAQAAVMSQSRTLRLSSLYALRPRLLPPGFTNGTTAWLTPFTINRQANASATVVRNDGRGELLLQFHASKPAIGPQYTLGERTLVRLAWPPAATSLRVTGTRTTPTGFVYR